MDIKYCDLCSQSTDKVVLIDNKNICDNCKNEYYEWCDHCREYHEIDDIYTCSCCGELVCFREKYVDEFDNKLCPYCWENSYACSECGRRIQQHEVYHYYGSRYCYSCNRNEQSKVGRAEKVGYSFKPIPIFYGNNDAHLGVELEVDGCYDEIDNCVCDILDSVNAKDWRIYAKEDGSLDEGFEIVSMPATLDYHLKEIPWKDIMERARSYGFTSHDAYTCGLHIHISNKAFSNYEAGVTNLVILFERFWTNIKRFSRRTSNQIEDYARPYNLDIYSIDNIYNQIKCASDEDRYYAINLQNKNTVEIRIFRGTLNYDTFVATLQFTQLCIDTVNELDESEIKIISWNEFVLRGWKYRELNAYLRKRGISASHSKRGCA